MVSKVELRGECGIPARVGLTVGQGPVRPGLVCELSFGLFCCICFQGLDYMLCD